MTPTSTYRLQVTADFDLRAAVELLPYLDDLGVGWVYLSPLLAAHPGREHGYDVVNPGRVDPARGGPEALELLSAEARVARERRPEMLGHVDLRELGGRDVDLRGGTLRMEQRDRQQR